MTLAMTAVQLSQLCPSLEHTYCVTQQVYDAFRLCSGDNNPLHISENFAHEHGFEGRVMYGNILNAFLSHFVGVLLPCDQVMIHAQDISFHAPVYLGDQLLFQAQCETVSEAVDIVIYKFKFVRNEGGKRRLVARGHVQIGFLP